MRNYSKSSSGGVDMSTVLLLVFVVLKLTGNISWSWWAVLSPLWITLIGIVFVMIIYPKN